MTDVLEWTSDLIFVAGFALLGTAVATQDPVPDPLRVAVVLPLLLFLPGYALLSALYPGRPTDGGPRTEGRRSVDGVERFVLSVALSLALTPGVALVANFTTGIRTLPIAVGLLLVTFGCVTVALLARLRTPPAVRFRFDGRALVADVHDRSFTTRGRRLRREGLFAAETNGQRLLNVVLVLALVVFSASVGFAAVAMESPADDETFTEFYLLGETEDGELSTAAVPKEFGSGESRSVYVGIENHEERQVEYTTVVLLQRVGEDGSVQETSRLDQFSVTVPAGGVERTERELSPDVEGDRLRLVFLLYRGDVPSNPTQENAYRRTRVQVTVGGDAQGALRDPADDSPGTGTVG